MEKITGPAVRPDADFFAPGLEIKTNEGMKATSREALGFIKEKFMEDEQVRELLDQPAFIRAMEKLNAET